MTRHALESIQLLLQKKIGFNPSLKNHESWMRTIQERMAACECTSLEEYSRKLLSSHSEFQELIELIIVPETWFFRDKSALDFLLYFVKKNWPILKKEKMRILSLPCSSGEEPYSIVMTFLEGGVSPGSFEIDGVDVSHKMIEKAKQGVYGKNSFRIEETRFRSKFFTKHEDQYVIKDRIREKVHFYAGNVLEPLFLKKKTPYDIIFCRYLLIYLDKPAQNQLFNIFEYLLANHGLLFTAHAESEAVQHHGYMLVQSPKTSAHSRSTLWNDHLIVPSSISRNEHFLPFSTSPHAKYGHLEKMDDLNPIIERKNQNSSLEMVQKFADEGNYEKAKILCLEYLKIHIADARAHFLLGLIYQVTGNDELAEELFQKAIYLEPFHYESLVYLALLFEKKGDFHQAIIFRERAKKARSHQNDE